MGQLAVIERSRLKALDIETVIALSTAASAEHVEQFIARV